MVHFVYYIIFILISFFCGRIEGYLWHFKSKCTKFSKAEAKNLHQEIAIIRAAIIIAFCISFWLWYTICAENKWQVPIATSLFTLSLIFANPFFHCGEMYLTRNNLNPLIYQERWFSNPEKYSPDNEPNDSKFDNADLLDKYSTRVYLFIASIILNCIIIIL